MPTVMHTVDLVCFATDPFRNYLFNRYASVYIIITGYLLNLFIITVSRLVQHIPPLCCC